MNELEKAQTSRAFCFYRAATFFLKKSLNFLLVSHSDDMIAGDDPIEGAEQQDTSDDEGQGHSIFDFMNQVSKPPTGNYKVKNVEIILVKEKKKEKEKD